MKTEKTKKILKRLHWGILGFFGAGLLFAVLSPLLFRMFPSLGAAALLAKTGAAVCVIWMLSAWYFLGSLLFSPGLRNRLIGNISAVKERDEREEWITGRAAKDVFFVTLAGLLAVGIWGMSTVNVFFIHKQTPGLKPDARFTGKTFTVPTDYDAPKTEAFFPFIGMSFPVEWPERTFKTWVQQNPGDKREYKEVRSREIVLSGALSAGRSYTILLEPPINPKLSRIMLLCMLLQVGLFHLFAKLTERSMRQ